MQRYHAIQIAVEKLSVYTLMLGVQFSQLRNGHPAPDVAVWLVAENALKPSPLAYQDMAHPGHNKFIFGKLSATNAIH